MSASEPPLSYSGHPTTRRPTAVAAPKATRSARDAHVARRCETPARSARAARMVRRCDERTADPCSGTARAEVAGWSAVSRRGGGTHGDAVSPRCPRGVVARRKAKHVVGRRGGGTHNRPVMPARRGGTT
uniref:Uncharacterized protein n=1 Tax=Arundo donax TaxID=35708 RepID=A0A0A9I1W7_ARUDO